MCKENNIFRKEFYGVNLEFDINKKKVDFKWKNKKKILMLSTTANKKIHNAFLDDIVYLNIEKKYIPSIPEKMLYYSSRNIMTRELGKDNKMYMDLLIYNSGNNVLYNNSLNRSLGHCNDVMEFEIHQVISGEVVAILKSPEGENYYGFFSEGDYIEIPAGWFHCTYVTKNTTVVANFYCNAYWEDNIENKPYFDVKNDICVEKGDDEEEYILRKKGHNNPIILNNRSNNTFEKLGLQPYSKLYEIGKIKKEYSQDEVSIFDLFYTIQL